MKYITLLLLLFISNSIFSQTVSVVPDRTDDNLIVASYNIKWIGQATHDLDKLAQVISHFDVCGIVEVKEEEAILELTTKLESQTGEDWGYVYGFRTNRPGGNYHEAYAAVFRRDRVQLGDGLISNVWDTAEVYRNDPFFVSFTSGNFDFTMLLVHTRWTDDDDGSRKGEIEGIKTQLDYFATASLERDILLMGDFNYWGNHSVMKAMATDLSFTQLDADPKTTFKRDYSDYANAYDHIYVSTTHTSNTEYVQGSAMALDVTKLIYGDNSVASMRASKSELSDHLPVFAIFKTNLRDDD